jgi:hypothetical protein
MSRHDNLNAALDAAELRLELAELEQLERRVELCSLGDRPQSPGVATLRRLYDLRGRAASMRADLARLEAPR